MPSPICSVIVVAFQSGPTLNACIAALLASTVPVEVLVSDNGSTDGSIDRLRAEFGTDVRLTVVENGSNLGFARAANRMLPLAGAPWLLFLNPDCVVRPDTLESMLAATDSRPEVGMAGCLIRNPDGSEQRGCRRHEPTPLRSLRRVLGTGLGQARGRDLGGFDMTGSSLPQGPVPVDAISGAFMLVRGTALDRVGPMDEGYFLHCEDLDWCRRFRDAGFTVLFVPNVEIIHHQGVSSRERPVRVEWHKHRGMVRYFRKFYRANHSRLFGWGIEGAVWTRFLGVALISLLRRAGR